MIPVKVRRLARLMELRGIDVSAQPLDDRLYRELEKLGPTAIDLNNAVLAELQRRQAEIEERR